MESDSISLPGGVSMRDYLGGAEPPIDDYRGYADDPMLSNSVEKFLKKYYARRDRASEKAILMRRTEWIFVVNLELEQLKDAWDSRDWIKSYEINNWLITKYDKTGFATATNYCNEFNTFLMADGGRFNPSTEKIFTPSVNEEFNRIYGHLKRENKKVIGTLQGLRDEWSK